MSHTLSRGQAIVLGLVTVLAAGLGFLGLFAVGQQHGLWERGFELRAGFANVRGVEEGTRVRVQGVDVGEVVRVELPTNPGGKVCLTLRIGQRFRDRIRADASARIVSEGMLGVRVIEIDPGEASEVVAEGAMLPARPGLHWDDVVEQVGHIVAALDQEKGRVAELTSQGSRMLRQGEKTLASIADLTEGIKRAPVIRNYVNDPRAILCRADCERNRKVYAAADLFEPERAVLTSAGRARLDEAVAWVRGLTRHEGSEVVVAAYADPATADPVLAKEWTRQQSEAVCRYLKERGAVAKTLSLWGRKITALGCGVEPPPGRETEPLPPARLELIVLVPQN
ncbi:MAG: MlaD family protein [Gemmataceae bacterium]|nr:MlaD family protein [Gemmataceae bacterium]MDW8265418.1 MlaD family protein [Gemmataceae bacterium]